MAPKLEVIATDEEYGNSGDAVRIVNRKKLPAIYLALRENVFIGEPIQENQGNNNLVFRNLSGPYGNYGWQLFKTASGTAMLEYQGSVSYWPHERLPVSVEKETGLQWIHVTFHQDEEAIRIARGIVERHTKKR